MKRAIDQLLEELQAMQATRTKELEAYSELRPNECSMIAYISGRWDELNLVIKMIYEVKYNKNE